jgi:hypothetical protein
MLGSAQAPTKCKLTTREVFFQATGRGKFFKGIEVLDRKALLVETACKKCSGSPSVAIDKGSDCHESQPELGAGLDKLGCGRISIENFIKLAEAVFKLTDNRFSRR